MANKSFSTFILMLAVSMTAMAQTKLTPQAQLKVMNLQKKAARAAARASENGLAVEPPTIRLVVKIAAADEAATLAEIRSREARVEGVLGNQLIVTLPMDSVQSMSRIRGVLRIDTPHRPRLKTDVTRTAVGVSQIDGTAPDAIASLTGKGVTVCVIDIGFDFQHRAFKDEQGRTRIKAVYVPTDDDGPTFSFDYPGIGEVDFPGSLYTTAEQIAAMTTDTEMESHGTHTAGIAAGSRSPQGFGGMAPDADIVLIPLGYMQQMADEGDEPDTEDVLELCLSFVAAYARTIDSPVVLSASLNSHEGPHNGTGTVPEAIAALSQWAIPVLSAGNEGDMTLHVEHAFTDESPTMRVMLPTEMGFSFDDEDSEEEVQSGFYGISREDAGEGQSASVRFMLYDPAIDEVYWQSQPLTITATDEPQLIELTSDDDEALARYFEGYIGVAGGLNGDKLELASMVEGTLLDTGSFIVPLTVSVTASNGLTMDFWETSDTGFEGEAEDGYDQADSDMSGGDWTTTPSVISVGSYCTSNISRSYDGDVRDFSGEEYGGYATEIGAVSDFSSYGMYANGVQQPTACAPGENIVSSWNHYECYSDIDESMAWEGFPYSSESGTSMACPVVAGIVALWLQACPTLTLSEVKEVLQHSSVNDEFTADDPIRWGYGKVNAKAGLDYIRQNITTAIRDLAAVPDGFPSGKSIAIYDLQGRRVSAPQRGIYIQNGRKVIIHLPR
ncbi:MAG: S8 family serine peptidase [Prevotella sp.]|nr:S8 family serine peptidase [Prevotella sp.]